MERLKHIKDSLISCVQSQMGNLKDVDAKELGEVVDMVKDMEEAIYYCTITKEMEERKKEVEQEGKVRHYHNTQYIPMPMYMQEPNMNYRDMDREYGKMYYGGSGSGGSSGGGQGSSGGGSSRGYSEGGYNASARGNNARGGGSRGFEEYYDSSYPIEIRDIREGKSSMSRKNYMESKEMHKGAAHQMQELEKYMKELSEDVTEMIEDASPEEKAMLQQKLSVLASKIK